MPTIPSYLPLKSRRQSCGIKHGPVLLLFLFLFFAANVSGQGENGYDEVSVQFSVPRIGNTEIPALIKNEEAWIAIKEVFDYLKIKNTVSNNLNSLSGFFIEPQAPYLIDKTLNRIEFKGKIFDVSPSDLVQTETGLYLKSDVFYKVFGLDCQFSFRNLSFTLKTNIELPALREMQQEQMRKNLSQLKGEKKADSVLQRSFSFLDIGMADWSVTAMRQTNRPNYLKASLALGAMVVGGEASAYLNYNSGQPFTPGKQLYRWRYVNNDLSFIKQISLGHITTPTVSSIFAPINGIQITNMPTTNRKEFGSYRYTGTTEPEWIVELYVNNILIDYVKADASGFFAFEIPIVYGNSAIRLKFYGPWGEENTREENITIPFNFLPVRRLEYTLSAGLVRDDIGSRFSRAGVYYGLNRRITLGAGAEYLSSAMQGKPMPFVNTAIRLIDGIILNGEYTQGVRAKATLNYRLPSSLQLDLSYIKYDKEQTAIRYNYIEERKASLTVPVHLKNFKVLSRVTYNQFILPKFRYSNAEFLLSATAAGISTNLRTYAQYSGLTKPYLYSNLSLSFRLPYGIRLSPQVQYQHDQKCFSLLKAEAEKRISDKGYLNVSYENNRYLNNSSITLGLRFDLSFARTFFSVSRGNKTNITTQSASGSLIYERKAGFVGAANQGSVGRGGFRVVSFLDLNCNNRKDINEPRVDGLNLRVSGGRVERRSDSSLLISGLEAYTSYLIELDNSSFDNIAWQIKKVTIKATVEPNQLRLIEVPVVVVGEASGMVYLKTRRQQKGLSRILVNFYDSSNKFVTNALTEGDGYFSFLGLAPGRYTVRIDTTQLHILNLTASPLSLSFNIASSEEGTIADGFEFLLQPVIEEKVETFDTTQNDRPVIEKGRKAETPMKRPVREGHLNQKDVSELQKGGKKGGEIVRDTSSLIINKKPLNAQTPEAYYSNKIQRVSLPKTSSSVQRSSRSVKRQSPQSLKKQQTIATKKQTLSNARQQIRSEQQRINEKQQRVFKKIQQLLEEQKKLVTRQRELIREIQQLRQKVLLKQGKN